MRNFSDPAKAHKDSRAASRWQTDYKSVYPIKPKLIRLKFLDSYRQFRVHSYLATCVAVFIFVIIK